MIQTKHRRHETRFQYFKQPSMTIPDQTMSLKTLLTKYSKGMPISAPNMNMDYTGDQVAHDFKKLDLAEQEERTLEAIQELSDIKQAKAKADKQKAQEAQEKALKTQKRIEELENELKTKTSINTP